MTAPTNAPTIDSATNRITALNAVTFTYDANGNLTLDDLYKYKYDAENRMVELRLPNDALIASYAGVYPERVRFAWTSRGDGNSLRVVKVWGADRTFYIYAGTQLISEFEDAASNTYNPGTTPGVAGADSGSVMLYQHSDHLTTRLTTDSNSGLVSNEQAHYPYGEQWYAGGAADPSVLRKFTSYQREDEATTGKLNYAVFREHSARVGRFLMADPKRGNAGNPQRLNRYAYVTGNPINRRDPRGLDLVYEEEYDITAAGGRLGPRRSSMLIEGSIGGGGGGGNLDDRFIATAFGSHPGTSPELGITNAFVGEIGSIPVGCWVGGYPIPRCGGKKSEGSGTGGGDLVGGIGWLGGNGFGRDTDWLHYCESKREACEARARAAKFACDEAANDYSWAATRTCFAVFHSEGSIWICLNIVTEKFKDMRSKCESAFNSDMRGCAWDYWACRIRHWVR